MNALHSKRDRRRAVAGLYRDIERGNTPRDITLDGTGVAALVGQQGTNEVWYAERMAAKDDHLALRVLLVSPTKSKGFQGISRRTGQPEFGERLNGCQYFVGDVTVRPFGQQASLGTVLRAVQEEFRRVQRSGGLDRGNIQSDSELGRVYDKWFADLC